MRLQQLQLKRNSRLFPSPFQRSFYILTLLRANMVGIAQKYLDTATPTVLVDFGCGNMPYRPILKGYVETYLGADLPDNPLADLIITVNEPLNLANASIDYVLSSQVLEHVTNPTAYLQECWRILKPNGLLILSTHGHYQYHPHPTDLWRWTSAGLQKVMTDHGFHIEEFHGLAGIGATSVSLFQYAFMQNVRIKLVQPPMSFLFEHLMWLLDSLWRKPARDTDALVYLLVARKVQVLMTTTDSKVVSTFYDESTHKRLRDYVHGNPRAIAAIQFALHHIPAGATRVLDLGCGVGWSAWEILRHNPDLTVIGVDLSPRQMHTAKQLFPHPQLSWIVSDLTQKGAFQPDSFDAIVMLDVYEHLPLRADPLYITSFATSSRIKA